MNITYLLKPELLALLPRGVEVVTGGGTEVNVLLASGERIPLVHFMVAVPLGRVAP